MSYLNKGKCQQSEIAMHTHDRISFRRCRRKWMFSSPFLMHLQPKAEVLGVNKNLWFGSGFHYALEDYHGWNKFKDPVKAFEAYCDCHMPEEVPDEFDELKILGRQMLSYYVQWEKRHADWKTVWVDGEPLVEVNFSLVLQPLCHFILRKDEALMLHGTDTYIIAKWDTEAEQYRHIEDGQLYSKQELLDKGYEYKEIVYHGTFDRVVEDELGDWWVLDYKTAQSFDTSKLPMDTQISAYCWAAEQWFQKEIKGMVYLQVSKSPAKPPKITKKGVSTDKRQRTTHLLYKQTLEEVYGEVSAAPQANIDFLNNLAYDETENGDKFVRVDKVARNEEHKINTYRQIIAEGYEMMDPNTAIYPNPTRDCSWDCPFKDMCLAMDEGADWESYLSEYEVRNETMHDEEPRWRVRMYRKNQDLFPEEYKKYCTDSVDSLAEFIAGEE